MGSDILQLDSCVTGELLYFATTIMSQVGSYIPKQGLQLQKEDLRFYTETGRETSQVDAQCSGTLCDHCPQQLTASSPAPQDQTDKGEHMQMAILVILALLLVVCLLLVCGLALSCAYFRRKVQGKIKRQILSSRFSFSSSLSSHISTTWLPLLARESE